MAGLLSSQRKQQNGGLLSEPVTIDERVAGLLGLDPTVERGAILPMGRDANGEMVLAWPQGAIDTLKALMLPGHVMKGGSFTPRDVTEMALDVGMLSSVVPAPAGAKRMFGGINAKNAPLDDLAKAEAMEKAGKAADDIWRATGWGRGADGKWRFEIDDSGAKAVDIYSDPERTDRVIAASVNAKRNAGQLPQATGMDDVLSHPELAQQYGAVPEGGVFFDDLGRTRGQYHGATDTITMSDAAAAIDPEQTRSTALHELQHAVQAKENFARGGSPETVGAAAAGYTPDLNVLQQAGSIKAVADQLFNGDMDQFLKHYPDKMPDGSPIQTASVYLAKNPSELAKKWEIYNVNADPQEAYRRLAGEVEARNVQQRMNMDAAERRATPPWATEDVPRDQQIVRGLLNY